MSEQINIKDIIKQEYILCASDPVHFMKKYCYIQHPIRGRILFYLYPFQEKLLRLFLKEDKHFVINKSRQLGISTLAAGYSLWLMLFHKDKNVLCIATKQETAKNMVTKVKFMFDNLPSWLRVPTTEHNKLTLRLNNGSQIKATSAASDAGRSEAVSLLLMDEAAFIDGIDLIWAASQQTLGCIHENSIIYTDKGLYRIKELFNNPEEGFNKFNINIFDKNNEIQQSSHFYKSPKSQTLKISFKDGNYIITTKKHPLLNNENKWVNADNLNIGDKIKCYYNQNTFGDIIQYPFNENNHFNNKKWKLNNIDLAYLIGLFIAEGSYSNSGIQIANGDEYIQKFLLKIGFKYYSNNVNYILNRKNINKLFKNFLKIKHGALNKCVPSPILRSSKEEQIAFLQGCFDGDGCSHKKGISYVSISENLVHDIHIMLLNFGIRSYIIPQYWKKTKITNKDSKGFKLIINKENSLKFYNIIGFRLERKNNNINKIKDIKNWGGIDINIDKKIIKDLIIKSNISLSKWNRENTNIEGFLWRNNKNISRQAIEDILNKCDESLDEYKLLNNKYKELQYSYYNEISNIEIFNNIETYDLKVPINESFLANNIVNHNTGGKAIVISTPNGVGNWFHKTFTKAEIGDNNNFIPIKLPWFVHPERDQKWRNKQDEELGDPKIAAQECDATFEVVANAVFYNEWIEYILQSTVQEPIEKRGLDKSLWIWEQVDYERDYAVIADVARGDGKDYSAFHVLDIITNTQVAEWRGQIPIREFGLFLMGIATEYNNALLVIDNASVGWDTVQTVIEKGYQNLYYSTKSDNLTAEDYMIKYDNNVGLTPGFSINLRTRPLIINKFREYVGDKSVNIRSKRLVEEMKVFVWKNGRAEAQYGYNDDLVMSFSMGMYLRDTTLKYQQQSLDLTKNTINNISKVNYASSFFKSTNSYNDPYNIKTQYGDENIKWLL